MSEILTSSCAHNCRLLKRAELKTAYCLVFTGRPGYEGYVSDSVGSEEQGEREYADTLRRKQMESPYARSVGTPSPVPSTLGNFVALKKGSGSRTPSRAGSEEGFLV